jgi:hypothetical protein
MRKTTTKQFAAENGYIAAIAHPLLFHNPLDILCFRRRSQCLSCLLLLFFRCHGQTFNTYTLVDRAALRVHTMITET